MKQPMKKLLSLVLASSMVLGMATTAQAAFQDFTDVKGHWAEATLQQAYEDGILQGSSTTTMAPNSSLTTAQAVTILCRVLHVTGQGDTSGFSIPEGAWYAQDVAKAVYAGLLDQRFADTLDQPIPRGEAFLLFARAFQLMPTQPDLSVLDQFPDTKYLTGDTAEAAAALVEAKKARVSPFYHDKLDALLDRYARRLAQWMNDYNRNQASYPSQFISGAGGYNMRKHEKQMSREGTLWNEYDEIKAILNKIEAVGSGPVDLADPHAREMLADQLQKLQNKLDESKALNAYYRKHKSFDGFPGMSAEAAAKLTASFADTKERCPWVKSPIPDYELTSLRGKIKRVQARLDELDKRAQQAEQPADGTKFPGGEIVRNLEADRLQILFDEKPDEDTRAALKQNGFRWSPRYSAWQRQLTPNAEAAARRALGLTE